MRKQIGALHVDAGIMMLGDPCYTLPDDGSDRDETAKDWMAFCDKIEDMNTHAFPFGHGTAVVVSTGYGDGTYPIYIETNEEGRVKSLTVTFLEDDEEEDYL